MRIVSELDFGGVEQVVALAVPELLKSENLMVKVIVLGHGGRVSEMLTQNGYSVLVLNQKTRIPNFSLVRLLKKIIDQEGPDVVHCQGGEANFHGLWAAKMAGVKTKIGEEIGLPNHHTYWKWIFKWVYLKADHVIAISEAVKNTILELGEVEAKKVRVIYNPVGWGIEGKGNEGMEKEVYEKGRKGTNGGSGNSEVIEILRFAQNDGVKVQNVGVKVQNDGVKVKNDEVMPQIGEEESFVFVTTCRLVPIKNLDRLLYCFSDLIKANPTKALSLWLIGDGSEREKLMELSHQLSLTKHVRILGYRENVKEFLLGADVFILPSLSEGSSVSLAEAMMAGLPSIVTEVGGAKEILGNSRSGILINPLSKDSTIAAMHTIITLSDEERKEMGKRAKTESNRFSVRSYVVNLLEVYGG
ncbi:glycosyltransferase [Cognataquiflexum nitidum]|uniref:glycosyltransferase n=1 Tax=Cognataquiflexum nitidum TaxID=2922272 RepID=UPI003AB997CD